MAAVIKTGLRDTPDSSPDNRRSKPRTAIPHPITEVMLVNQPTTRSLVPDEFQGIPAFVDHEPGAELESCLVEGWARSVSSFGLWLKPARTF